MNLLSVLHYAIEYLKVPDIIVCGHYGCGGVIASMKERDHGVVEHWLSGIRDVARLHDAELTAIEDPVARERRLVELNIVEQCVNLLKSPIVQKSQIAHGFPRVHGMVFDIADGVLQDLNADLQQCARDNRHIFARYDFRRDGKGPDPADK
jgi:carbonic anhydrase